MVEYANMSNEYAPFENFDIDDEALNHKITVSNDG